MTDKRKILDIIRNQPIPVQVWAAEVTAVDGLACTVVLTNTELEVDGVTLVANPDASEYFTLIPKVGSRVLVGLKENEIADLYVVQYTEIDSLKFTKNNVEISADVTEVKVKNAQSEVILKNDSVAIKQGQTEVSLSAGKVALKNAGISLNALFADLITLLNSFSVITSTGPSAGLNPATAALLVQLQAKVNSLLQ